MEELVHDAERLTYLQSLPLDQKIMITKARIAEYYNKFDGNVSVSFSGGKDSTVLLHLVRSMYPNVQAAFSNTGLEFPEIQQFVKSFDNVLILKPKQSFSEVISKYGYPIISKEVAETIYYARKIRSEDGKKDKSMSVRRQQLLGEFKYSMFDKVKWLDLCQKLPAPVSNYCCYVMKKSPAAKYVHATGLKPYVGTMAVESLLRRTSWLQYGCNIYDSRKPQSRPMSFWTEQDVLEYIRTYNLPICSVYGDIIETECTEEGCKLKCEKCQRTGCIYCGFGLHKEIGKTRFQLLAETHPKQYEFVIGGGTMG